MRKVIRMVQHFSVTGVSRVISRCGIVLAVALLGGCTGSNGFQEAPTDVSFDVLLSAAFGEYAQEGDAYAKLHRRHLGVTQPPPDTSKCPPWPDVEVGARTLRLGYITGHPLHTVDESGQHVGFESELALELVRRINAHYPTAKLTLHWVLVDVKLPVGPAKNSTAFRELAAGLRARSFDIAFSCIVPVSAPDIAYLSPTMTMFPGVIYTGRDNLDVSSIHDRDSLVVFLATHPGLTFVHGMGVSVFEALAADVAKAGGKISVASGGMPHFRMADILGLSKMSSRPMMQGVLLDVNPRLTVQRKATFALKRETSVGQPNMQP